jgi:2-keto-4-pentenoate hydratase/2-oxohepta-3-ene-1,7-dioic acid hydratase in catechol pathway
MRLATFRGPDGTPRSGAVIGDAGSETIVDLAEASGGTVPSGDLLALLQAGPSALDAARAAAEAGGRRPLSSVELLAPIRRPGKLLAVAGNFQAHIEEGGGQRVDKTKIVPKLFIKPSSAIIGPAEAVALPTVSNQLDWELELAIVIGTAGRDIPVDRARDHIAGYSIINDISARSMQWGVEGREPGGFDDFFDWLNGKWGDGFAAWGPYITTTDSVKPDPNELEMTLKVNGKTWQHGSTADMIFTPEEIIAFASRWMTLEPGDVIAGGTLDGTGDAAGVYLNAGDVMEGTIGQLGTLVTPVVASRSGGG